MNGELDPVALGKAWEAVVARHQALRTDYRWEEVDTPLQIVFKQRPVQLQEQDWRGRRSGSKRQLSNVFWRKNTGKVSIFVMRRIFDCI